MRKITSKHEEKKKENRKGLIVGTVLILIMLLSIFGYSLGNKEEDEQNQKIVYKGFEFVNSNGLWILSLEEYIFAFKYNPNEVQKIDSELKYINSYENEPLYIFSENIEAKSEIYQNFIYLNSISKRIQDACLEDKECEGDLPVKTCEENLIVIEINNEVEISQEDNCVFIKGPEEEIVKITDEFLFKILSVE